MSKTKSFIEIIEIQQGRVDKLLLMEADEFTRLGFIQPETVKFVGDELERLARMKKECEPLCN